MSSELDLNFFPHGQKPGSLELAYVGDAVYELFVRAQLTLKGGKANALSDLTVAKVRASEGKPLPKSKWQQRLEEAQKMQEQMQREQARKRR